MTKMQQVTLDKPVTVDKKRAKPRSQQRLVRPRCKHSDQPNMAYIDWHQDAIARRKRGEKQIFCHECGKYVWAEYWPNKTAYKEGYQQKLTPVGMTYWTKDE